MHTNLRPRRPVSTGSAGMIGTAPQDYDVVVAGGGIVGAACTYFCAQAGLRVALVERDFPGGGATAAGMGHIVVLDDSEAQFALTRHSQQLWRSEEHTSELQSQSNLVCRLLL